MNRNQYSQAQLSSIDSQRQPAATQPRRGQHRQRDFGIGYGSSSGYGCTRRYAAAWTGAPRFRCV